MQNEKVKIEGIDVWIQAKTTNGRAYESEGIRVFSRVPIVGEYFKLDRMAEARLYKVTAVLHLPFDEAESRAEVYGVEASDREIFQ